MPYNLLLFPLLGGFVFVSKCAFFRHKILRYDNQRLIFASALAGAGCLFASFALVKFCNTYYPWMKKLYLASGLIPFEYAPTMIGAFLLGCVVWKPINWLYTEEEAIRHTILRNQDPLETLLLSAFEHRTQIMLTLKNSKVYIGWVTEVPNPVLAKHIKITPSLSGYRHKDTKDFTATTDYAKALKKARLTNYNSISIHDFTVIVPVAEIQSAATFNSEVFSLFASTSIVMPEGEEITEATQSSKPTPFKKLDFLLNYGLMLWGIYFAGKGMLDGINTMGLLAQQMVPFDKNNIFHALFAMLMPVLMLYILHSYALRLKHMHRINESLKKQNYKNLREQM